MCSAVEFLGNRVFFRQSGAELPVRLRNGNLTYIRWGRLDWEHGHLPQTCCARLESIKEGRWERWRPRPVKIKVDRFMERDSAGAEHWYDLAFQPPQFIQGLVATYHNERRVYIVTIPPATTEQSAVHGRWPRVIT